MTYLDIMYLGLIINVVILVVNAIIIFILTILIIFDKEEHIKLYSSNEYNKMKEKKTDIISFIYFFIPFFMVFEALYFYFYTILYYNRTLSSLVIIVEKTKSKTDIFKIYNKEI